MEFNFILQNVAKVLEISQELILQPGRKQKQVDARCIIYLILDAQNEHPTDIAGRFNQHRSTVIYGLEKAKNRARFDRYFKTKYQKCSNALQLDSG